MEERKKSHPVIKICILKTRFFAGYFHQCFYVIIKKEQIIVMENIFKAYDVRGLYPKDLNEETAFFVGRAFVQFLKQKTGKDKLDLVLGRDNRSSSLSLFEKIAEGITAQGANVIDIGLSTTPLFYFSVAHFGFDGGVEITASHNPKEYNGFKLVREKAIPVGEDSGLREIKEMILGDSAYEKGKIIEKNFLKDYLDFNLQEVKDKECGNLKIAVDTANAVVGAVIPDFFKRLGVAPDFLFLKLDGTFPNHNPDPLVRENLKFLQEKIKKEKLDLGIAFDGDGDRVIFVDEKGDIIPGDMTLALMAKRILENRPEEKIGYDIRSSNIIKEIVSEKGGMSCPIRIGHSFIKAKMRQENIIFAGELSGHYYHRDHYFCEAPLFVIREMLKEISENKEAISKRIHPFKKYFQSGEINFKVEDKEKVLRGLEQEYGNQKTLKIDGLRVDFDDWWFIVRPSNTEPLLRMVLEAKTKKILEEKERELRAKIESLL